MIKGSIQKEDITIINIYAPNTGAPQYVRQMLTTIKVSTISVLLLMSPFIVVSICLTYCGAPVLGAYIFINRL